MSGFGSPILYKEKCFSFFITNLELVKFSGTMVSHTPSPSKAIVFATTGEPNPSPSFVRGETSPLQQIPWDNDIPLAN